MQGPENCNCADTTARPLESPTTNITALEIKPPSETTLHDQRAKQQMRNEGNIPGGGELLDLRPNRAGAGRRHPAAS